TTVAAVRPPPCPTWLPSNPPTTAPPTAPSQLVWAGASTARMDSTTPQLPQLAGAGGMGCAPCAFRGAGGAAGCASCIVVRGADRAVCGSPTSPRGEVTTG